MAAYRSLVAGGFFSSPDDSSLPASIRFNNPGAINTTEWVKNEPGFVKQTVIGGGNPAAIFESPEHGVAVWHKLMQKYRAAGATTVRTIITRYGGGQDYAAYAAKVAEWSGLAPEREIALHGDDATLLDFARAMFRYEAGKPTPLSDAQIFYGFALARKTLDAPSGVDPTPRPAPAPSKPGGSPPGITPAPGGGLWGALLALLSALFGHRGDTGSPPDAPRPQPVPLPQSSTDKPPWFKWSEGEIGFHEKPGNHGIEKYLKLAKCGNDGDPYCAIGANAACEATGFPGTRSAMARSFEHSADFKRLDGPAVGAFMTFWRGSESSGSGHVTQYAGRRADGRVMGLGWNQSDSVNIAPQDMSRLTGYWWPKTGPAPKVGHVPFTGLSSDQGSEV